MTEWYQNSASLNSGLRTRRRVHSPYQSDTIKNRFYSHSATHHTTLSCAAWREEEVPSSHTEPPPATLPEAGQQEATTSAASEEEEEEEGNVISVHCTASLWRRGTSIPHGYVCSTVFPHSAPSSRLLTPQEKNTEKQNHALPKKKKKKFKNEAGERCEMAKNAYSFYWIQSSLQRRHGEGREAGRRRCKKSNNADFAANANNNTAAPIPAPRMEFRKRRSFQVGTGTWITLANIKYDINICLCHYFVLSEY